MKDTIERILYNLILETDNKDRAKLYKNFYSDMSGTDLKSEKETTNKIYSNLSGLIAHAELSKSEYDLLKQLLAHLATMR